MNIMEYDSENLDVIELNRLFSIFKEESEKEGHTAIAMPKDITILQDVDRKTLYKVKEMIDEELKRKTKESEEEYRKSKAVYLFKCYEANGQLIKIIDFDFSNQYSMICVCLDWTEGDKHFALTFDSIGLFCNDYKNPGHQIIEQYKEISEEEFRVKFNARINEICFGEYRCQG
jgi:hypothetical protein